jgi:hypothetical protein
MIKTFFSILFLGFLLPSEVSHAVVPTLALTFDTNVQTLNMSSPQEAKIQSAEEKIKAVVATEEFRKLVLNHTYNGVKTFVNNNGLSNAQIYQKILQGAEKLQPAKNNAMDLIIKLYYQNSSTIGYTTIGSKTIYMNTKYFNQYNAAGVSHNMMHEWLHKLGFGHAVSYSPSRDYSVPYAIGYMLKKLAAKY